MSIPLKYAITVAVLLMASAPSANAQSSDSLNTSPRLSVSADTSARQLIRLRDGSVIIGRVTESWNDSARVESAAGTFTLRNDNVVSVRDIPASSIHDGVYWPDDPSSTRLYFAPTARMLKRGEGYMSNHWLFLLDGYVGVTDRFTIGGAMTLFPSDNFLKNNVYFISPKFAVTQSKRFQSAVGAWVGHASLLDSDAQSNTFGILYGVGTWSGDNGSVTAGTGYGFANGKLARNPMVMLGGSTRVSRSVSLVSENWLFPNTNHPIVSFGVRLQGEKYSWDLGGVTALGANVAFVVPWIGVAWKF